MHLRAVIRSVAGNGSAYRHRFRTSRLHLTRRRRECSRDARTWRLAHAHRVRGTARELLWAHMAVDPRALLPAINAIVYTSTQGEWWGDLQANDNPELLALPHLDVTLFSTPVTIMDATIAKVVCCTWAVVDFSYEDSRVSKEIHRIRNEADPLFEALASVLGSPMTWRIVPG